jgi:hypothetical protein
MPVRQLFEALDAEELLADGLFVIPGAARDARPKARFQSRDLWKMCSPCAVE